MVVREAGEPGQPRQITMLEGSIEVGASGDAVTLVYTIGRQSMGLRPPRRRRVRSRPGAIGWTQLIVPTSE